jgi:hypothetical protein
MEYLNRMRVYLATGVIGLASLVGGCTRSETNWIKGCDYGTAGIHAAGMASGESFRKKKRNEDDTQRKIDGISNYFIENGKVFFEIFKEISPGY